MLVAFARLGLVLSVLTAAMAAPSWSFLPNNSSLSNHRTNKDSLASSICGVKPEDPKTAARHEKEFKKLTAHLRTTHRAGDFGSFEFPVIFHVISAGDAPQYGQVPDEVILAQMDRLNEDFSASNTGFSFNLLGVNRVRNPEWYFAGIANYIEYEMYQMSSLRQGDAQTLNIYTVGFDRQRSSSVLGYARFPNGYSSNPGIDGILLNAETLPGGMLSNNNLGRVLVHEIGHWLGLYHTFEGASCLGPGDQVDDTPTQAQPSLTCSTLVSTCGAPDPVFNFMNYADDMCLSEFTPGQTQRMWDQVRAYRGVP